MKKQLHQIRRKRNAAKRNPLKIPCALQSRLARQKDIFESRTLDIINTVRTSYFYVSRVDTMRMTMVQDGLGGSFSQ